MQRLNNKKTKKTLFNHSDGSAVVEATFVFPIMFMVFFALVLLSFYLPQRAMLQRATQFAATAIATEMSDTWIYYDGDSQTFGRYANHGALRGGKGGVYITLFKSIFGGGSGGAETTIRNLDEKENIPIIANGELTVECEVVNYVVYKEVAVTATRSIPVPIDLSFIQFPRTIDLAVTSTAVVQNGDDFIRSVDLAGDFLYWASEKLGIDLEGIFSKIGEAGQKISGFFGI
ncbi:MAG: pilus assembly protein [Oscillospiraceae bacterium]|jgi:Flp pilus assembly protein TadG|nr:pilus assembly protein [Oscillospiraceae bacterium]